MATTASNRAPSPLPTRDCRNSEANSTIRRSFSGNPFARPTTLTNPRSINPPTPANSPATTDHMKRHSVGRKSIGNSMFQDGKENQKDVIRSPAKGGSKNFMAPTISASSKFTPSPRKRVLGEKNDLARNSIQFLGKDSDLKPETTPLDQTQMDEDSHNSTTHKQKRVVFETPLVHEVTLNSMNDATEMLSEVTEDSGCVDVVESCLMVRPFCCSPQTSPIVAPPVPDSCLPPYDPKKNFLSPRPQFLRYKPNPRIEVLLNKVGRDDDYGEEDVTRLEGSFNLSENSSDTEEEPPLGDSVNKSSEDLSEMVPEEKPSDSKVKKASKPRFLSRSKTVSLLSLMFIIACVSLSFTDSPPMDLPIYKDVSFSEIYHEALKLSAFVKESFDYFVENLKQCSTNLASYLLHQKSQFSSTGHKISSIRFFNLTISPPQELLSNRHIGTDYVDGKRSEQIQEVDEEMEAATETVEEAYQEMEVDDDSTVEDEVESEELNEDEVDDDSAAVEDEVESEELNEVQPSEHMQSDDDGLLQTEFNLEDGSNEIVQFPVSKSEAIPEPKPEMVANELETLLNEVQPSEHMQSDDVGFLQMEYNLEDVSNEIAPIPVSKSEAIPEASSEMVANELETLSSLADSSVEVSSEAITQSETLSYLLNRSINTISLACFLVMMVAAASVLIYINRRKSDVGVVGSLSRSNQTDVDVDQESSFSGTSVIHKSYKKKPRTNSNKRESLASSSDFSMGSPSYGSFTTYERIPIKHGEEEIVTPIRRSSRLLKNQVTSS